MMTEPILAAEAPKLTAVPNATRQAKDPGADAGAPGGKSESNGKGLLLRYQDGAPSFIICSDRDYIRQLSIVCRIKELLISEAVELNEADRPLARLGVLNSVRYGKGGASPPPEAWDDLDARLQGLTRYLKDETGELKRKLQLRLAPRFLYFLPLATGLLAACCLCLAIAPPGFSLLSVTIGWVPKGAPPPEVVQQIWRFVAFMLWLIALGSLGSVAFLYVNVLSIETDKSVDVTSVAFISMRIILGALFGLVIGLPVAYPYFVDFCRQIHDVAATSGGAAATLPAGTKIEWANGLALLLPFLLGFSTPLVLNVLNRFIDGAQTFFGIQQKR